MAAGCKLAAEKAKTIHEKAKTIHHTLVKTELTFPSDLAPSPSWDPWWIDVFWQSSGKEQTPSDEQCKEIILVVGGGMFLSTNGFVGWLIYEYNKFCIGHKICKHSGKMCVKIQGGVPPRHTPLAILGAILFSIIGLFSNKAGLILSAIFLLITAGSIWQVVCLVLLLAIPSWLFPPLCLAIVKMTQGIDNSQNGRTLDPTIPIRSSINWIRSTYPKCETIKLVGYSSGGTLAAMYCLLESTTEESNNSVKVGKLSPTAYCLSGIYDFEATAKSFGLGIIKTLLNSILVTDIKQCPMGILRAQLAEKESQSADRAVKRMELIHCTKELFGISFQDYIFKPREFKELLEKAGLECDIHLIEGSHWSAFFFQNGSDL